jgi:hypothetical protein
LKERGSTVNGSKESFERSEINQEAGISRMPRKERIWGKRKWSE